MAMAKCRECGIEVSDSAKTCPKCGISKPIKKNSLAVKLLVCIIAFVAISRLLFPGISSAPSNSISATPPANAAAATTVATPKQEYRPGAAVGALIKETDKIEHIDWYRDKSTPNTWANNFNLYMGVQNNKPWLRIKIGYAGDSWLFIQNATVVADGEKIGMTAGNWERDSKTRIFEWIDMPVNNSSLFAMLQKMVSAKEVIVRYEGRQYRKDRTLSRQEIKAISNVLAAYAEMGGTAQSL
jgi:hypothetical protein